MKLEFSKMQGLGNDFVIINNIVLNHKFSPEQIRYLADRKFGIGCDQILLVENATDGISDFLYRIYNSDGSKSAQCGNGARCFIRFVCEKKLTDKTQIKLQTESRIIEGAFLESDNIEVNMGNPDFTTMKIPLNAQEAINYQIEVAGEIIEFAALSMGNPHAVINLSERDLLNNDEYLARIGESLQSSRLFPESVNVNFVLHENQNIIHLRTYERGCGFTLACGSGACASAAVFFRSHPDVNSVLVKMIGGELAIKKSATGLLMRGSAIKVFDGEIDLCVS